MKDTVQNRSILTPSRRLAIALWCLISSFATLVPGSSIETRDFSR
nr:hypothetical protein [Petrachloros mirabilis]